MPANRDLRERLAEALWEHSPPFIECDWDEWDADDEDKQFFYGQADAVLSVLSTEYVSREQWEKDQAAAFLTGMNEAGAEAGQYEQVAADLTLHLRSLCEHPANFEHRYEIRDGYPCPGCFDALIAFDALYRKSTEAGGEPLPQPGKPTMDLLQSTLGTDGAVSKRRVQPDLPRPSMEAKEQG